MGRVKPWTEDEDEQLQAAVVAGRLAASLLERAYTTAWANGHARNGTTRRLKEIENGWNYWDVDREKARSIAERIGLELLSFMFFRYGAPLLLEKQSFEFISKGLNWPFANHLAEQLRKEHPEYSEPAVKIGAALLGHVVEQQEDGKC